MAVYTHRSNSVLRVNDDGLLAPVAGYFVMVLEPGGIIQSGAGTAYVLEPGHGLATGDKIIAGTDASTYRSVTISGDNMTLSGTLTMAVGTVVINLGPDTGGLAPLWDGSGATIYSDSDGGTADTDETLTTAADGSYGYWADATIGVWELVRNGNTVVDYEIDVFRRGGSVGLPASSTDRALVPFDGTSGTAFGTYSSNPPTASLSGAVAIPGTLDVDGAADFDSTINVAGVATFQGAIAGTGFVTLQSGLSLGPYAQATIAAGLISVTNVSFVSLSPESGTADNLDYATGAANGQILVLRNHDTANTITVRQVGGGSFLLLGGTSITLNTAADTATFIWTGSVFIPWSSKA